MWDLLYQFVTAIALVVNTSLLLHATLIVVRTIIIII